MRVVPTLFTNFRWHRHYTAVQSAKKSTYWWRCRLSTKHRVPSPLSRYPSPLPCRHDQRESKQLWPRWKVYVRASWLRQTLTTLLRFPACRSREKKNKRRLHAVEHSESCGYPAYSVECIVSENLRPKKKTKKSKREKSVTDLNVVPQVHLNEAHCCFVIADSLQLAFKTNCTDKKSMIRRTKLNGGRSQITEVLEWNVRRIEWYIYNTSWSPALFPSHLTLPRRPPPSPEWKRYYVYFVTANCYQQQ